MIFCFQKVDVMQPPKATQAIEEEKTVVSRTPRRRMRGNRKDDSDSRGFMFCFICFPFSVTFEIGYCFVCGRTAENFPFFSFTYGNIVCLLIPREKFQIYKNFEVQVPILADLLPIRVHVFASELVQFEVPVCLR